MLIMYASISDDFAQVAIARNFRKEIMSFVLRNIKS